MSLHHRRQFLSALNPARHALPLWALGLGASNAMAAGEAARPTAPPPSGGIAVPIGGALRYDNSEVWQRLVDLAGGPGARFAVFATAAGNPERSARQIINALQRHGAVAEHIAVGPRIAGQDLAEAVRDPAWIAKVRACRGVFFAGGAQERIVETLQPGGILSPLLQAVWDLFNAGGVVAGSSAGAAIMSRTMFRDAQDVMTVLKGQLREGQEVDRGLGFVGAELFVDQHFLKRGRIGRMLPLMLARGYQLGLGVEENSAAIVRGQQIEVIGAKGALLVDLSGAQAEPGPGPFSLRGARLSYLDRGDSYDLGQRAFTPSAAKLADLKVDPNAADFKPFFSNRPFYLDMLGDNALVNAMTNLIDNPLREVRGLACNANPGPDDPAPGLGFEFRLYKGADSLGWFTGTQGGEDYSVAHLYLDVRPVRLAQPLYTAWSAR